MGGIFAPEEPIRIAGRALPRGGVYLLIGLPLAVVFGQLLCGLLRLGTSLLFHESGHTLVALFFGHPALPSAAGLTHTFPQQFLLALAVWVGLVAGTWKLRETRPLLVVGIVIALAYPLLARARFHVDLIFLGGHGAEVVFASFFFWRALKGGFHLEAERPIYAMLGWYLWGRNLWLCGSLLVSPDARAVYESIAITADNDMVVVARSWGWSLEGVATLMLGFALLLPLSVLGLWAGFLSSPARTRRLLRLLGWSG